jgi:hypothetical protein
LTLTGEVSHEIDLPDNGRPRLLDVVVVLDGLAWNAYEWTTQSEYAALEGFGIQANPFRVEIDVMGAGDGGDAPHLSDTLEIDCRPKQMVKADWLGPSRPPDQGVTRAPWDSH